MDKNCNTCAVRRDNDLLAEELAEVRADSYRLLNELNNLRDAYAAMKAAAGSSGSTTASRFDLEKLVLPGDVPIVKPRNTLQDVEQRVLAARGGDDSEEHH